MATVDVYLGAQYGDESKGGITFFNSPNACYYVRVNGGNNAGHEVEEAKLHYLSAGILHGKKVGLANGVVIYPPALFEELDKNNLSRELIKNVLISERAKVTIPSHYVMDGLYSIIQGDMAAGSTFKGIAPTYGDKTARFGISFSDLLEPDVLEKRVKMVLGYHRKLFSAYEENLKAIEESMIKKFGEKGKKLFEDGLNTEPNKITKEFHELGLQLKNNIVNLSAILNRAYFVNDESIVFEGAQGFHLDVDHGIYPYGTSSNIFSIEASAGFPLGMIDLNHKHVYGVVKIPMSRVGGGPKPTKIGGTIEDILREKGKEYGTTTGRPRDVCWPCEVMVREAIQTCGITDLAIVKTDVLGGIDTPIKVNTHYTHEEMIYKNEMPASMKVFAEMEPNYREEEPWDSRETWEWKDVAKQGIDGLDNTHQIFLANFAKNVNIFNFISNGKVIISVGPSSKAKFSMPFKELVTYATQ